MYSKVNVKNKPSLKTAMQALEDTSELLQEFFHKIDDSHPLFQDINEMLDYNHYLYNKYYNVDEHLGCANWPNCDEEGCGYD